MIKNKKIILLICSIILTVLIIFATINNRDKNIISYNEFLQHMQNNNINEVFLTNNEIFSFRLKDSQLKFFTDNPRKSDFKELLLTNNILVSESEIQNTSILSTVASTAVIGFIFIYFLKVQSKTSSKSLVKTDYKNVEKHEKSLTLQDIAGNEEAKESVKDIIDFIKNPEKYKKYGARMPKGLIFYGPPGTGKTLMAKAIAGEANAAFYAVSGSDFVQMYVGVGASRIRELFKKAAEDEKAVIFIDEIDALGKKRSSESSGGSDERDQTLNALLTEMSGFSSDNGIIVIAATNRIDILDDALLRPGRFDRQIEIALPDINARKRILDYYCEQKPLSDKVNTYELAKQTVYFSGAMLENLMNEASILAAKSESHNISIAHIDKAYYTIIAGSEKTDRSNLNQAERKITAYHEAGHALLTKILLPENSVSKVTIIPSIKGIGGFSLNIPPDKMYYTKKELESQIIICLAGRASEEIIFGIDNITTGASNDIERASKISKDYVTTYGMSQKIGLLNTKIFTNDQEVKEECFSILEELYKKSISILTENKHTLEKIALELLEKETLKENDLDIIIAS